MPETAVKLFRFEDINPRNGAGRLAAFPLVTETMSQAFGMNYTVFNACTIDHVLTYDEVLYCVSGEIEIVVGIERYALRPQDAIWLPNGTKFQYVTRSTATVLAIYSHIAPSS